jgi:ribosomal protein S17E
MLEYSGFLLVNAASWAMLAGGVGSIVVSFIYSSSALAFVGLGLTFWGVVLLYVRNRERPQGFYRSQKGNVRREHGERVRLFDVSAIPLLAILNQIVQELNYKGEAMYLPARYFQGARCGKIFIAKQKESSLPTQEQIQRNENRVFMKDPQGLLLMPLGTELARLFKEKFGADSTDANVQVLEQNLSKFFTEDLKIAEKMEVQITSKEVRRKIAAYVSLIQTKEDTISLRITNSIYKEIYREPATLQLCGMIGATDVSAIVCVVADALGTAVKVERIELSQDGRVLEAICRIIDEG